MGIDVVQRHSTLTFFSVTRTAGKLSAVCETTAVPPGIQAEHDLRAFDTDYLFVRDVDVNRSAAALQEAGHCVLGDMHAAGQFEKDLVP